MLNYENLQTIWQANLTTAICVKKGNMMFMVFAGYNMFPI